MPSDRQGGVADATGDPDYYTVFGVHGGSEVAGGPGSSPSYSPNCLHHPEFVMTPVGYRVQNQRWPT